MRGTLVCDLDGVLYLDGQEIAGAGGALSALDRAGLAIVFCTNNSSKTRAVCAQRISRVTGYPASESQVVTSAAAAASLLATRGKMEGALVVGGEGVVEAMADAGIEVVSDPDHASVVVVGLDVGLTYDKLVAATHAVRRGADLVATNLDATFPAPDGLRPGAGAIVAAIETASGVTAEPAGKPFAPMRRLLRSMTGDGPVWMVGDRADTDLAMAHVEGWTSVLVMTGVTTDASTVDPPPHLVLDSIAQLPAALLG